MLSEKHIAIQVNDWNRGGLAHATHSRLGGTPALRARSLSHLDRRPAPFVSLPQEEVPLLCTPRRSCLLEWDQSKRHPNLSVPCAGASVGESFGQIQFALP